MKVRADSNREEPKGQNSSLTLKGRLEDLTCPSEGEAGSEGRGGGGGGRGTHTTIGE